MYSPSQDGNLKYRTSKRLLRNHDTLAAWLQILLNTVFVIGLLQFLAYGRDGVIAQHYLQLSVITPLLMWIVYYWRGVYRRYSGLVSGALRIAQCWSIVLIGLIALGFLTKTSAEYSRLVLGLWAILGFVGQVALYFGVFTVSVKLNQKVSRQIPAIIVGSHALAKHLAYHLNQNAWLPDQVVGIIDDDDVALSAWTLDTVPVLGHTDQLLNLVAKHGVRRVYIALPLSCSEKINEIHEKLEPLNVDIIWSPDVFSMNLLNLSVREVAGVPLLNLSETPLMSGGHAFVKSLMDRTLAFVSLLVFAPLMIGTAIAIKVNSQGPVFFRQQRHGWDGKVIDVWKFRSMYVKQPDAAKVKQATRDDPRITPIGRFIRRTSIDELPQLFNVLNGTMSMVGPRPHALVHNEYYSDKIKAYMMRHRIKPGITGMAQVNGYRGETETLDKMEKRIEYDLAYINNWSIWLDLIILIKTPISLFSKDIY